jgi:hypothetical protein
LERFEWQAAEERLQAEVAALERLQAEYEPFSRYSLFGNPLVATFEQTRLQLLDARLRLETLRRRRDLWTRSHQLGPFDSAAIEAGEIAPPAPSAQDAGPMIVDEGVVPDRP